MNLNKILPGANKPRPAGSWGTKDVQTILPIKSKPQQVKDQEERKR